MVVMAPMANAGAQGTETPAPIFTVTPVSGVATAPAPSGVGIGPTEVPREFQAFRKAREMLAKKINRSLFSLTYVKAWTWSLELFNDSALGCPPQGAKVTTGPTAGYRITIAPFQDTNNYEFRVSFDLTKVYDCGLAGTATSGSSVVVGKAVGGAFEAGAHIQDFNSGVVDRLKASKLKWVKKQLRYGDGSGPGIISAAKGQGFKVLLSVVGTPTDILSPGFFDQYASFVAGLAGSGADAIEVWNEMNLDREWPNGQINPAQYVQMLQKAYSAIKAANGNTIVISGAPAPTGAAGPGGKTAAYWNDDVYVAEMAAAGAAKYADCIGLHYNEGIVSPTKASGDPRDSYPTRYFSTMLDRALAPFPGMKGCFTEIGFLTPEGYGPLPGGFAWAQNVTLAQQAQWLAEAAVLSATGGRVRLMIIFNMDFTRYDSDPQAGYAMIRPGGACPACTELAKVLQ